MLRLSWLSAGVAMGIFDDVVGLAGKVFLVSIALLGVALEEYNVQHGERFMFFKSKANPPGKGGSDGK